MDKEGRFHIISSPYNGSKNDVPYVSFPLTMMAKENDSMSASMIMVSINPHNKDILSSLPPDKGGKGGLWC